MLVPKGLSSDSYRWIRLIYRLDALPVANQQCQSVSKSWDT